jgi:hypothetical protein
MIDMGLRGHTCPGASFVHPREVQGAIRSVARTDFFPFGKLGGVASPAFHVLSMEGLPKGFRALTVMESSSMHASPGQPFKTPENMNRPSAVRTSELKKSR